MSAARAIFGWSSPAKEDQGEAEVKGEGSEVISSGTAKLETGPVLKPASASSTTSASTTPPSTTSTTTSSPKPSSLDVKGQSDVSG